MRQHDEPMNGCPEWNESGGNGMPRIAEVTMRRHLMRSELNPDADYATWQATRHERRGDTTGAQVWRDMRWGSHRRQVQGRQTHLRTDE
jgi:hypothetical protein